jgi:hypothetical protein
MEKLGRAILRETGRTLKPPARKNFPPGLTRGLIEGEDGLAGDSQMKYSKFERG